MLANEQVIDGACWRCGSTVVARDLEQWFFRITQYADELLKGLDTLTEWPEKVVVMQRNWIGRSEGARVKFAVAAGGERRRPRSKSSPPASTRSTAPPSCCSRPSIRWSSGSPRDSRRSGRVPRDRWQAFRAHDREARRDGSIAKEGFDTGRKAINPFTGQAGADLGRELRARPNTAPARSWPCPAHDERDFEFARKYNLPITRRRPGRRRGRSPSRR